MMSHSGTVIATPHPEVSPQTMKRACGVPGEGGGGRRQDPKAGGSTSCPGAQVSARAVGQALAASIQQLRGCVETLGGESLVLSEDTGKIC